MMAKIGASRTRSFAISTVFTTPACPHPVTTTSPFTESSTSERSSGTSSTVHRPTAIWELDFDPFGKVLLGGAPRHLSREPHAREQLRCVGVLDKASAQGLVLFLQILRRRRGLALYLARPEETAPDVSTRERGLVLFDQLSPQSDETAGMTSCQCERTTSVMAERSTPSALAFWRTVSGLAPVSNSSRRPFASTSAANPHSPMKSSESMVDRITTRAARIGAGRTSAWAITQTRKALLAVDMSSSVSLA